jgi:hypothetical protein
MEGVDCASAIGNLSWRVDERIARAAAGADDQVILSVR